MKISKDTEGKIDLTFLILCSGAVGWLLAHIVMFAEEGNMSGVIASIVVCFINGIVCKTSIHEVWKWRLRDDD